jgi:tetratricopeptide (TPR) repeat protein
MKGYTGLICIMFGIALFHGKSVFYGQDRNYWNVKLIQRIGGNCNKPIINSWVMCKDFQIDDILNGRASVVAPCQILWQSRTQASQSLSRAQVLFDSAMNCERKALVYAWGGELSWLLNDNRSVSSWWEKLSLVQLIGWGQTRLQIGEIAQGRRILETALVKTDTEIQPLQRFQVLSQLAYSYQLEQDWRQAVSYYRAAYELMPEDPKAGYDLAVAYRQNGQPQDTVNILEKCQLYLPPYNYGFNAYYYIQWGLAYNQLGYFGESVLVFQQAKIWMEKSSGATPEEKQFIQDLLDQAMKLIR